MSEKDKREVNNLIRFMQEKKYHDSQYEELLNQYIELSRDYEKLENIIKEVREYIENNILYEQDYDYDYEENLTEYPPSDEQARKDILEILDKTN